MIAPPHSECGDGTRSQDEACDDHNVTGGDGCAADCLTVDPGYSCQPPGMPCHRIARCGDGVVVLPELCDDNNATAGDGCSATCKIEIGWKCSGNPSTCSHTTCGDRKWKAPKGATTATPCRSTAARPTARTSPTARPQQTARACRAAGTASSSAKPATTATTSTATGARPLARSSPGSCASSRRSATQMVVPAVYRDFRAKTPNADFEPPGVTGRDETRPSVPFGTHDFQSCTFGHSGISPEL